MANPKKKTISQFIQHYISIRCFLYADVKVVAADRDLLAVHGQHGVISIFALSSSQSLSIQTTPWATATTPKACEYDSLTLCRELDCVVLYNRWQAWDSPDVRGRILLYTTSLALRAIIYATQVVDVLISPFGVVVVTAMGVKKYDFCGNLVKEVELGRGV